MGLVNWKKRNIADKTSFLDRFHAEVDAHNDKVRKNSIKDGAKVMVDIAKTERLRLSGGLFFGVTGWKKPFIQRIIDYFKKKVDIEKGEYSAKQRLVKDHKTGKLKWEYVK